MTAFHFMLITGLIVIPCAIFFAEWWNDKHGFDRNGDPIEQPPHKEAESG